MGLEKLMRTLDRRIKKNNEEIKSLKPDNLGKLLQLSSKNEAYIEIERFIIEKCHGDEN